MELKSLILSLSSIGQNMEREGRREDEGAFYYLWIPFKFIYQTLRSLLFKLFGPRTPSNHTFQVSNSFNISDVCEGSCDFRSTFFEHGRIDISST